MSNPKITLIDLSSRGIPCPCLLDQILNHNKNELLNQSLSRCRTTLASYLKVLWA